MRGIVPLVRFLDPRPAELAAADPIPDSVSIPLDELPQRMHELPPRHSLVEVVGPEPYAGAAVQFLTESGREAKCGTGVPPVSVKAVPALKSGGRLWKPNDFLAEVAPKLKPGAALDLACGTGRDAVYLASLGWEVTAIDHLPDALERGRDLARRYLPEEQASQIHWLCMDLETHTPQRKFDLISIFWFLNRDVIKSLPDLLNPGGHVIIETFTTTHRERFGKPRTESYVLKPDELQDLLPNLAVVAAKEDWHGDRHSIRYLAAEAFPCG